jgi:hypothetical protein
MLGSVRSVGKRGARFSQSAGNDFWASAQSGGANRAEAGKPQGSAQGRFGNFELKRKCMQTPRKPVG